MQTIKCVLVGDYSAGRKNLVAAYITGKSVKDEDYVPRFSDYSVPVTMGGRSYSLALYDLDGQEDYSRLRPLSYQGTDVFLFCFSVVNPDSYENIREEWFPEVQCFCKCVPFLVVGTKVDLRKDSGTLEELSRQNKRPIAADVGAKLAQELKAVKYLECSASTQEGVKTVFDEAILAAFSTEKQKNSWKKSSCTCS